MGDHVQGEEVFEIKISVSRRHLRPSRRPLKMLSAYWIEAHLLMEMISKWKCLRKAGQSYTLFLHSCPSQAREFMQEMLSDATDFQTPPFSELPVDRLRRWFGLTAFVLLTPNDDEEIGGDELARLMGALNVALMSVGRAVQHLCCMTVHDVISMGAVSQW